MKGRADSKAKDAGKGFHLPVDVSGGDEPLRSRLAEEAKVTWASEAIPDFFPAAVKSEIRKS